ncbi:class I SAM-dependent methyltransferase [Niabella yanshanensis]|uniref:Class I SAM-dependent methyltransferase n=1 Tax=Niabella yanshanensis TaxID=577386 RepID=A0ABZ0WBH1_9BACT|nr:class I SAM-dependent methyltransferase [Niabella yanshanensis]WQD39431.1 class I SAM-dependent methyltransferase [Niabella yanshanensis]
MSDPKQRFSNRVADYIKYRPKYPKEVIDILKQDINLRPGDMVADIGAGTGFLTELFLDNGNLTYAVEPNEAMRNACTDIYGTDARLKIVDGSAEMTQLGDRTIDLIVAGTAFHWFDAVKTKQEFTRILKPGGHILLIWNVRKDDSPFTAGYEAIFHRRIPGYEASQHRKFDMDLIRNFLHPHQMKKQVLANSQSFDWEGFKGRALSSSFMPQQSLLHDEVLSELYDLFLRFEENGKVLFQYDTVMYYTV